MDEIQPIVCAEAGTMDAMLGTRELLRPVRTVSAAPSTSSSKRPPVPLNARYASAQLVDSLC